MDNIKFTIPGKPEYLTMVRLAIASVANNAGFDYDAIEDIKSAMIGMLEPEYKEVVLGTAEVRETYKISNVGTIAGCYVKDGKLRRNAEVRIIREGVVVFEGVLASLKRFKDDAKEVAAGYECGLSIDKFNDIKEGDLVECFVMEAIQRKEL